MAGLSVGDLTFGECRPDISPKCIVRCRDNDIDLSYRRRAEPRRDASRGVENKRDSLSLVVMMAEVDRERVRGSKREKDGERREKERKRERAKLRLAPRKEYRSRYRRRGARFTVVKQHAAVLCRTAFAHPPVCALFSPRGSPIYSQPERVT